VVQFDKEASQTRDYCVANNATLRAARPDPSLRKERLFRMKIQTAPLPSLAKTEAADPANAIMTESSAIQLLESGLLRLHANTTTSSHHPGRSSGYSSRCFRRRTA
jgi:hypothetical protein